MKHISSGVLIGILSVVVTFSVSAEDGAGSESGYYAFSSGELLAAYKSGFLPVLSGD